MEFNFYVWKPSAWQAQNGFKVDYDLCRYSVWDDFTSHQCSRRYTIKIGGYGFCTQHAKIIEKRKEI